MFDLILHAVLILGAAVYWGVVLVSLWQMTDPAPRRVTTLDGFHRSMRRWGDLRQGVMLKGAR